MTRMRLLVNSSRWFVNHISSGGICKPGNRARIPGVFSTSADWAKLIPRPHLASSQMVVLRELVKMRYLWNEPHRMGDKKLEKLLGDNFGTPFEKAVADTVRSYIPADKQAPVPKQLTPATGVTAKIRGGPGYPPVSSPPPANPASW